MDDTAALTWIVLGALAALLALALWAIRSWKK
jgi:LPXTG-motif cell wall-anchored protein